MWQNLADDSNSARLSNDALGEFFNPSGDYPTGETFHARNGSKNVEGRRETTTDKHLDAYYQSRNRRRRRRGTRLNYTTVYTSVQRSPRSFVTKDSTVLSIPSNAWKGHPILLMLSPRNPVLES